MPITASNGANANRPRTPLAFYWLTGIAAAARCDIGYLLAKLGAHMNFPQAIASGFRHYVTFAGRASRSEYWLWVLFTVLGGIVTGVVDYAVFSDNDFSSPLNTVFNLVCFLPSFAITFRRLHDIGRTGWWWLIAFTIIGIVVLIVWACQKSDAGPNAYGPPPVGAT